MLEMSFFRESHEIIRKDLEERGMKTDMLDSVIECDKQWRELIEEGNRIRAERNEYSKLIGEAKKKGEDIESHLKKMEGVKKRLPEIELRTTEAAKKRDKYRMRVPNILEDEVPTGNDETGNKEIKIHGNKPNFDFDARSHNELLEITGSADLDRAAKISGRRFYFLSGAMARMEMALVNYAIEHLTNNEFELTIPPYVMNREAYEGVVDLGDFEEVMYKIDEHDLYLIATSEHPLTARFKDEIIETKSLPLKYCGMSTNFRREVGAHGLSDRGIWRVHQFAKVEQVIICKPEDSKKMHGIILDNAVKLFEGLEIPFRVVDICKGDIGTVAARKFDLEAWMPSVGKWKEIVSASNCTSYQSVRLNMRYRTSEGTEFPHTLNATAIATTRALAAIIENNQQTDGSIVVPKVLQKWMSGQKVIEVK